MRVVVRGLLGLAVLSALVSCRLDMTGLHDRDASVTEIHVPAPDAASGAAGTGAAGSIQGGGGTSALAGQPGIEPSGAAGSDAAGTSGAAGETAGIAGATGEAGTGAAGAGEAGAGAAGTGMAGAGEAGMGAAGTGAAGMGAAGTGAAGTPPISKVGCADETREGYTSLTMYPAIAACSGAWQIPGLVAPNTYEPQCQRHPGVNGAGCSVADLCAEGWHVCASVAEVKERAASCTDAFAPSGGTGVFFATRQRGTGMGTVRCEAQGDGTNNLYGCGNLGSPADQSCRPFTTMLRDFDCMSNSPWSCVDGPINYNVLELAGVKKPGNARGGVLCCR